MLNHVTLRTKTTFLQSSSLLFLYTTRLSLRFVVHLYPSTTWQCSSYIYGFRFFFLLPLNQSLFFVYYGFPFIVFKEEPVLTKRGIFFIVPISQAAMSFQISHQNSAFCSRTIIHRDTNIYFHTIAFSYPLNSGTYEKLTFCVF